MYCDSSQRQANRGCILPSNSPGCDDPFIIGVVMSLLKPLWNVGKIEESLVDSTALLASAFGALLFGRIADMLGRKRIYGVEVLVLAI